MKKFWFIYKNHLATILEYRSDLLFSVLLESISVLGIFLYWEAIFRDNSDVGNFSRVSLLSYYLLMPLVYELINVNIADKIGRDIKDGILSNFLLKPFSSQLHYLGNILASKTAKIFILVPFYILPLILAPQLGLISPPLISLMVFLLVMLASLTLYSSLDFLIGYSAFWVDDVWAFRHVKEITIGVLGGLYFPLDIVNNQQILGLINYLPFKYIFFVPLKYLLGQRELSLLGTDLLMMLGWTIIFVLAATFAWKRGIRKFEAYGN